MKLAQQISAMLLSAAIGLSSNALACPPRYSVQVIAGPSCGDTFPAASVTGLAINEQGDTCGILACTASQYHAWVSHQGSPPELLAFPSGNDSSYANAINDKGAIAGHFTSFSAYPQYGYIGFVRDGNDFIPIFPPKGSNWVEVAGINNENVVVGSWGNTGIGPFPLAFRWHEGVMQDISVDLPLKGLSRGLAINDAGQITGWMGPLATFPVDYHAFIWSNGKVTDLGIPFSDCFATEGRAINSKGQVAGIWWKSMPSGPGFVRRGFFWDGTKAIELGQINGLPDVFPQDVTDDGTIVGWAGINGGSVVGFLWHDGVMHKLQDLIPADSGLYIDAGYGINEQGQILARAMTTDTFVNVALILTPIPPLVGDATCDELVNIDDILAVVNGWGPCPNKAPCSPDLNDDLSVNVLDLMAVIEHWQ